MDEYELRVQRAVEDYPSPSRRIASTSAADVWGDGRDEVLLFNAGSACIYANARPSAIPTLYNETLYPGM